MKKTIQKFLLFVCFVCMSAIASGTHIVGGVIYYEYLGNGNYRLTFEIYRDCTSQVGFDGEKTNNPNFSLPPFYFSVFEGTMNENLYRNRNRLFLIDTLKIRPVIVNPCLNPAKFGGVCVVKGRYETIINLPKNNVGYTVQYVRCCRNSSILNIENQASGDKPGITLRTYIPPYGSTPNNSARFKNFPPMFICAGQQFYFDHSATDADGDALSYHITTPLAGANSFNPIDSVQSLFVNPVVWSSGYSESNVMGGTPPMAIDSATGLLSCKPANPGRYVVSILVKERRNGKVIDSFARDFQYNVVDCDLPNANYPFIPGTYDPIKNIGVYINCGNFKVDFTNTSTNADRYEWRFGDPRSGAANISTDVNPTHTFTDTGTYIVTLIAFKNLSNGELCLDSTRRICKIYPPAKANFDYEKKCQGFPIQFTDKTPVINGAIGSWEWTFGDGETSMLQNPVKTYAKSGTYTVKLKVTTTSGCVTDTNMLVTVYPKPTIAATIPKACIGQILNLNCNVTIPSPYTIVGYRWTLPSGATFSSCNTSFIPTTMVNGTINLWAISDKGCRDSANFTYIVNPLPIIKAYRDTTLCYNKNTTISASGGVQYRWSPPLYLLNTTQETTTASPPYPDSIIYKVKGTDANGCYNYDSIKIKFYKKSFIDAGPDTSVCLNPAPGKYKNNVQLTGKGTFRSIYWTPVSGLNNPNISNPIATPIANTDYVFNGIDTNNCLIQDTVRVTVLDPKIDLVRQKDQFICQGDTFVVQPEDQGLISKYTWSPNYWISNANIRSPFFWPRDTISYILTIENYCYTKSDTILVNVSELPDMMLKDLDSICVGSVYSFFSNPNLVTYLWKTSEASFSNKSISNPTAKPTFTQRYTLSVVDQYGCKNTDSIQLNVNYPPNVYVSGIPNFICQGDSVLITAQSSANCTYLWKSNQYLFPDNTKSVYAFPFDTTKFSVLVTSIQKCSTLYYFTINVQKPIQPFAIRPVQICKGKFIDLFASGGLYYLWTPSYNINDTLSPRPQVFPEYTFNYQVRISNDCFVDSIKVDVYVDSIPYVNLGRDTSIYRGQEITLVADNHAETIEWFPKEVIASNPFSNQIDIEPQDTTLYWVEATNGRGCIGRDSVWVYVYGKNVLLIPTGFSPNKDGINDVFRVAKYLNIRKLNFFEVYNRWGEKVFSTTDIKKGWDGIYQDVPSPVGAYVWKIEAINFEGEKITQSGTVTLIR